MYAQVQPSSATDESKMFASTSRSVRTPQATQTNTEFLKDVGTK